MSFGGPDIPDTAAEQRRSEEERAARVRATSEQVNKTFDERFGPSYYEGLGTAFRDYYKPQINDQFTKARRAVQLRYADNSDSSAANRTAAELAAERIRKDQDVESGAQDAMNQAKQDVENKRGNLISLAEAGQSLENTSAQARAAAATDIGRPTFSPIGDLFGKYANTLAMSARAGDAGYQQPSFLQKQTDFLRSGGSRGSQRIVGG